VAGALVALALSPVAGVGSAFVATRALRRGARRMRRGWEHVARGGQWAMSSALAFSHGANDAAKSIGVIAAILLADGRTDHLAAPLWATLGCAVALTAGTMLGGWRMVRTVGMRIYPLRSLDAVGAQGASAGVIIGATFVGAPVSTTQVVASSVVGTGGGRRRWHHVRWSVVRDMGLAWLVTIPATAGIAALALLAWKAVT
jgi:PiT family inorganic phosphate transporter